MAPAPPTDPSSGNTDSSSRSAAETTSGTTAVDDKLVFDVSIGAYAAADEVCRRITEELAPLFKAGEASQVFYLDNALREALDLKPLVEMQLRNLQESYRGAADAARRGLALFEPAEELAAPRERDLESFSALAAAPAVIDAAVAFMGLLREDRRYTGITVTIPEHAFALTLARHLLKVKNVSFCYPTLFLPLGAGDPKILRDLVSGLDAVVEQRRLASTLIERLAVRLIPTGSDKPQFPDAKAALDAARDAFQDAEAVREEFQKSMTTADPRTGLSRVQLLERAGYVERKVNESPQTAWFLFAQVVAAGGASMTASGLKADLTGDKLKHAAGVVATFGMFRRDGTLVASRTLGFRSEYVDSDDEISF